jgi:hypothetical protein
MNDFLMTIAPTVASALLSPLGGIVVAGLGKILGIDKATTESVSKAITDSKITPDQLAEIKKLELQLQANEEEHNFKYKELEFKDTEGARAMQIAVKSNVPPALAGIVTLGFFGILGLMIFDKELIPSEPLLVMLGSLGTAWTMIIGFYFGSSHGSQSKDAMLVNSQPLK